MKKILLGLLTIALLATGGGVWWLYSERDSLIADAIRTYGPPILGVSLKLRSVKTDVANQSAALHGLVIGNPGGFNTAHAVSLGTAGMKLDVATLTKDVILIREILIVKPDITYEYRSGGSNLDVIQRNVEKFVAEKTAAFGSAGKGPGKKLIIENLYIKGAKAEVSADLLKGKTVSVSVPDIHLADIGKRSSGVSPGEATRQIISAVTASVTRSAASSIGGSLGDLTKKGGSAVGGAIKGLFK